jgi:hypothetical protein
MSGVVRSLCEEFEHLTKKSRVYISSGLREKLRADKSAGKKAKEAVAAFLEDRA